MATFGLKVSMYLTVFGAVLFGTGSAGNPEENGDLLEGDIVEVAPSLLLPPTRSGQRNPYYRWPNAIIPYTISSGYPADSRRLLQQAMYEISRRTCIRFTPRTNQRDYVEIYSGSGCSSSVGRIGGRQLVSLPTGCRIIGTFIHELIHAIGFFHEQSRTDRDTYVTVNYNNIESGRERNFLKYDVNAISNFGVGYDYGSVMHYPRTAFSKNGRDTITPKRSGVAIGQRVGISAGDVAKINNMYCR